MVPSLRGSCLDVTSVPFLYKNMYERLGFNLHCEVTSVRVCDKAAGDEIHNFSQMPLPSAASAGIYSNHLTVTCNLSLIVSASSGEPRTNHSECIPIAQHLFSAQL